MSKPTPLARSVIEKSLTRPPTSSRRDASLFLKRKEKKTPYLLRAFVQNMSVSSNDTIPVVRDAYLKVPLSSRAEVLWLEPHWLWMPAYRQPAPIGGVWQGTTFKLPNVRYLKLSSTPRYLLFDHHNQNTSSFGPATRTGDRFGRELFRSELRCSPSCLRYAFSTTSPPLSSFLLGLPDGTWGTTVPYSRGKRTRST